MQRAFGNPTLEGSYRKIKHPGFSLKNKTQLKLHTGMQYKGVTQRGCP